MRKCQKLGSCVYLFQINHDRFGWILLLQSSSFIFSAENSKKLNSLYEDMESHHKSSLGEIQDARSTYWYWFLLLLIRSTSGARKRKQKVLLNSNHSIVSVIYWKLIARNYLRKKKRLIQNFPGYNSRGPNLVHVIVDLILDGITILFSSDKFGKSFIWIFFSCVGEKNILGSFFKVWAVNDSIVIRSRTKLHIERTSFY